MQKTSSSKQGLKDTASFRDPDGFVFYSEGSVYRYIVPEQKDFFKSLLENDKIKSLIEEKKLIATREAQKQVIEDDNAFVLQHQKIDFITYPHEWSSSQLIDAALFTLEIQLELLEADLCLKDASPYNVQFVNNKPVFIDFSSIEKNKGRKIWLAYNQFLETFFYPILLKAEKNISTKKAYIVDFNGVKVEEARESLGSLKSYLGYPLEVGLPYLFRKDEEKAKKAVKASQEEAKLDPEKSKVNISTQSFTIKALKDKVLSLKKKYEKAREKETTWSHYYSENLSHYSGSAHEEKRNILRNIIKNLNPDKVLDLGSNTGEFSLIAEKSGAEVLSIDLDDNCIDQLYNQAKENELKITALWSEIDNPSPAIGWRNLERKSLIDRLSEGFNADCVLALALMHHMLISSRIPLQDIIDFFASLTSKYLIIEYVGPEDEMFLKILGTRENIYAHITEISFKKSLEKQFKILESQKLETGRIIYTLEKLS